MRIKIEKLCSKITSVSKDKDSLKDVFKAQKDFNEKIHSMDKKDVASFQRYHLAAMQEMAEVMDKLNWKFWKTPSNNGTKTDWGGVKEELIDVFHFFVSMCLVAGMSSEDLIQMYFKKNKINHERQKS